MIVGPHDRITHGVLDEKRKEDQAIRADAVIAATQLVNPALGLDVFKEDVARGDSRDVVGVSRHLQELTTQIGMYIKHGVWPDAVPPDDEYS